MKSLLTSLAASLVIAAPVALSAQGTASLAPASAAPAAVVATSDASAPSMVRADVAGIQTSRDAATHTVNATAAASGLHQGQGVALMAVGGAGLVAGLLIGGSAGSAVAIGGLAVGLVGLYEYVR
jgi:hypothetical protein